jgi:hypothetical protein
MNLAAPLPVAAVGSREAAHAIARGTDRDLATELKEAAHQLPERRKSFLMDTVAGPHVGPMTPVADEKHLGVEVKR